MDKFLDKQLELGNQYPMADADAGHRTKDKILIKATLLFAQNGYEGVSIKDITSQLGINASTLYNYFDGKEELWMAVLDNVVELYMMYFRRLDLACADANTYEQLLDAMFAELLEVVNIFTYYAFGLVQAEQFRDERAGQIYNEIFLEYSIDFIAEWFEKAIAGGWAQPFDTRAAATVFMHSVLIGMNVRVQQDMQRKIPYEAKDMFKGLYDLLKRNDIVE